MIRLYDWADKLAGFYGYPVYLCGSALVKNNPRDWDVRIEMPDQVFSRRFGDPHQWIIEGDSGEWSEVRWRWAKECVQRTDEGVVRTGLNIDFQIYPLTECQRYRDKQKIRLDGYELARRIKAEIEEVK